MKEVTANFIREHASDFDVEVMDDYSGRGMFGKQTFAVTMPSVSALASVCANFALNATSESIEENREALEEIVKGFRSDSMGMDIVIY